MYLQLKQFEYSTSQYQCFTQAIQEIGYESSGKHLGTILSHKIYEGGHQCENLSARKISNLYLGKFLSEIQKLIDLMPKIIYELIKANGKRTSILNTALIYRYKMCPCTFYKKNYGSNMHHSHFMNFSIVEFKN